MGKRGLVAGCVWIAALLGGGPAHAGTWMQVSCANPNGTSAPDQGWTSDSMGNAFNLGSNSALCQAGSPMSVSLTADQTIPVGVGEYLQYTPPTGSTLVGGTLQATMSADGDNPSGASGIADLLEPGPDPGNSSDVFFSCAGYNDPHCAAFGDGNASVDAYTDTATLNLPANAGGDLYVLAACQGYTTLDCGQTGVGGAIASAQVGAAQLLLSSAATPQGSSFGGSILQPNAGATAHLVFTATDAGGPGVYTVTAALDGGTVWSQTPSTNGGECTPVGTDSTTGALMFDWQQPCPQTEVVDVPIDTSDLPDGSHELTVTVTDAARNSSTVLDQRVTTSNPLVTPAPAVHGSVRARFTLSWRWSGMQTLLRSVTSARLPKDGTVRLRCAGPDCPQLRRREAPARRARRLLHGLAGRVFHSGDRLYLTVTAPHRRAERIEITINANAKPGARLLRR